MVSGCWFAADEALFAAFQSWFGAFSFVRFFWFLLRVWVIFLVEVTLGVVFIRAVWPVGVVMVFGEIIRVPDSFVTVSWYFRYLERGVIQVGDE